MRSDLVLFFSTLTVPKNENKYVIHAQFSYTLSTNSPTRLTIQREVIVMKRLGELVKQKRIERGFSIRQVAKMAGVSSSYLYAIESDHRGSKFMQVAKIAQVLGISLDDLAHQVIDDGYQWSLLNRPASKIRRVILSQPLKLWRIFKRERLSCCRTRRTVYIVGFDHQGGRIQFVTLNAM